MARYGSRKAGRRTSTYRAAPRSRRSAGSGYGRRKSGGAPRAARVPRGATVRVEVVQVGAQPVARPQSYLSRLNPAVVTEARVKRAKL